MLVCVALECCGVLGVLRCQEFFIDTMMQLELGLESPDPDDSPAKAGLAMFLSFVFFGVCDERRRRGRGARVIQADPPPPRECPSHA